MGSSEAGDRRRWVTELLDEHEAPLTRFARRLTGDEHTAVDVVQHAFLRLCEQSPEAIRGREAQWLFTVCRNRATDLLRRRGRHEPLGEQAAELPEPRVSDPAELTEREELHERLSALVDDLPLAQREVLLLHLEGFRNTQIAAMTDRSEANVRVLVHRAIKQLRNCREIRTLT